MSRWRSNPWVVLVVLCTGFFMILLDTTIVNIAIPSMIDALHASLDQILWVLNAYILVYAVLLISAGRLGDIYGQRNMFAAGMALFVIASAFCGLAQDTNQLVAARVVQGIGGALLTPQTMAILTSIFPPERRGAAFGIWGAVAGVASVAGPTLGGLIVTSWSWRWIFYVNLPIGIVAFVATFLIVPDLRPGRRHGLDLVGVALASAGLLGVVFGLIEGQRFEWGAVWGGITIPMFIVAGVLLLVAFVAWERTQREPLINLSLFKDRNFTLMNWVGTVVAFGLLGMFLPLTIYLQSVLSLSALDAGLTMAPLSFTALLVAPWSGRLSDTIGGKYILMAGLVLFSAGMGYVALTAGPDSNWSTLLLPLIVAGFGQGCVFAPMASVAMRHISPRMAGAASGVLNTTRQLGAVLGSAVIGAVLQNQLVTALHDQAVTYSAQLPPSFRQGFVDAIGSAVKGGLEVGRSHGAGAALPSGIPPQMAEQLSQLYRAVFVNGFITALRPSVVVPVVVLFIGALSCLAVEGKAQAAERARAAAYQPLEVDRRQSGQR